MVCDLLPIEKLMGSQDTLLYYSTHCYSKLPRWQYVGGYINCILMYFFITTYPLFRNKNLFST